MTRIWVATALLSAFGVGSYGMAQDESGADKPAERMGSPTAVSARSATSSAAPAPTQSSDADTNSGKEAASDGTAAESADVTIRAKARADAGMALPPIESLLPADTEETEEDAAEVCIDEASRDLLLAMRERRTELDRRAALLSEREDIIANLEHDLDLRIQTALGEVARLEEHLGIGAAGRMADRQKLDALVETVGTLSSRKSAPILEAADTRLTVTLLRLLGPEKSGSILSKMPPAHAARLVRLLAPDAYQRRARTDRNRKSKTGATP